MSVRTITYKIDSLNLTPFPPQWGGIQGEDNATKVEYVVNWGALVLNDGKARIDFNSPTAGYDPSEHFEINNGNLARDIPIKMTQGGGQITSTLVIENENGIVLSVPSVIYFTPNKKQDGRVIEYLSSFEQMILNKVAEAQTSATNAQTSATNAQQSAEDAETSKTNAEIATVSAVESATKAQESANNAQESANNAQESANNANVSAVNAETYKNLAENASIVANDAATSASNSATQAENASIVANDAATSASNSATQAENAKNDTMQAKNEAELAANEAKTVLKDGKNLFSNALKGNPSGISIGVADASPMEHNAIIKTSSDTVTVCGKNLIDYRKAKKHNIDDVLVVDESINGFTFSGIYCFDFTLDTIIPAGSVISLSAKSEYFNTEYCTVMTTNNVNLSLTQTKNILLENDIKKVQFFKRRPGTREENMIFTDIQLEIGAEPTEYVPYKEHKVTEVIDGVAEVLIKDNFSVISTDANTTVEYNRDINKAFEELKNAILATGGNV